MQSLRVLTNFMTDAGFGVCRTIIPSRTIKYFAPPKNYDDIVIPERQKLRFYEKVPVFPSNVRPPKMQKRLRYMRGPEELHNFLVHKQFGIVVVEGPEMQVLLSISRGSIYGINLEYRPCVCGLVIATHQTMMGRQSDATCGGRLRHEHFEMIRLTITRKLDIKRMFAIWRVDPPWQPVTKKTQGMRMGGGKGAIDHYVTPVKAGRVIVEVAGKCEYWEVYPFLNGIVHRLPFRAKVVSQESLEKEAAKEKEIEMNNTNPYTFEYVIKNNMGGCHKWLSKYDHRWFGKYI